MATPLEITLNEMLGPSLETIGYDLVRVQIQGTKRTTLQIMIDHADSEAEITIEDCEKASRHLSAVLDVEDPISSEYHLEVSSPGIDRPLVKLKDFANERYKGLLVKVTTEFPVSGWEDRKRFQGLLQGVSDNKNVLLELPDEKEEEMVSIEFSNIVSAKLVLNDDLIAWATKNK